MNWDAIGAVGEIIGALAVVVTLAYLALQIRASTRESEAGLFSATAEQSSQVSSRFMEHAEVWVKGNAGGELSESEQFVLDELVRTYVSQRFFAFTRNMVHGTGREGVAVSHVVHFFRRYPVAYRIWRTEEESQRQTRQRVGTPASATRRADEWFRKVSEAVAALEAMEESEA